MARLVVKDNITSRGALAVGQTLRLGGFVMTARSAVAPTMTSREIENSLHIGSKFAEQMDPMQLSSLNELLDCIAALGVATDYDQIGLKTDLRPTGLGASDLGSSGSGILPYGFGMRPHSGFRVRAASSRERVSCSESLGIRT